MKTLPRWRVARILLPLTGTSHGRLSLEIPLEIPYPTHLILPEERSFEELATAFDAFCTAVNASLPLVIFPEGYSGWPGTNRLKRKRGVEVSSPAAASRLMQRQSHFRTRYFENYYAFDATLAWFALFCHDDDIHFWVRADVYDRGVVQAWQQSHGAMLEGDS